MKTIIHSKKFWVAIAGVITVCLSETFGLDETAINNIVYTIIAYLGAQGLADFGKEKVS